MLRKILVSLLILSSYFLMSCQTNMLKEFEKITPGMEKDDVLSHMGSPKESLRLHGRDRWIYVFYEDQLRFEKEVHFFDGSVVYAGGKWEPSPENQAAAVDAAHAKQDIEIQKRFELELANRKQGYDDYVRRAQSQDRVKYLPEFVPVQ